MFFDREYPAAKKINNLMHGTFATGEKLTAIKILVKNNDEDI